MATPEQIKNAGWMKEEYAKARVRHAVERNAMLTDYHKNTVVKTWLANGKQYHLDAGGWGPTPKPSGPILLPEDFETNLAHEIDNTSPEGAFDVNQPKWWPGGTKSMYWNSANEPAEPEPATARATVELDQRLKSAVVSVDGEQVAIFGDPQRAEAYVAWLNAG